MLPRTWLTSWASIDQRCVRAQQGEIVARRRAAMRDRRQQLPVHAGEPRGAAGHRRDRACRRFRRRRAACVGWR